MYVSESEHAIVAVSIPANSNKRIYDCKNRLFFILVFLFLSGKKLFLCLVNMLKMELRENFVHECYYTVVAEISY